MSTFLQNGKILIKVFHQFMIFNQKGVFVNKVGIEPYEDKVMPSHSENLITLAKFYGLSQDLQKEEDERIQKTFFKRQSFTDFEDKPYNPLSDKEKISMEDNSENRHQNPLRRLELINFSYNNKYFLFLEKTDN